MSTILDRLLQHQQLAPTPASPESRLTHNRATRVPTAFEPHCLMTWQEMCAGMDDMGDVDTDAARRSRCGSGCA